MHRFFRHPILIRIFCWEYWSFHAIYGCIYPIWLLFSLRARSFFFFAAANPRIRNGGFTNESKKEIYFNGPLALFPKSVFFDLPCTKAQVVSRLSEVKLAFPLVAKPDIGARGQGVKILRNEGDLDVFLSKVALSFHIQEMIDYPNEVGIFYCRFPDANKGRVTGIVRKEFLTITGDGVHSIDALLQRHPRALMYLESMRAMHRQRLTDILLPGETLIVSPYGNHARGALFLDDSHLIDDSLNDFMNAICRQIPEFYYGRLDIRFSDWEALKQGQQFCVIEVNGAGSEPTHMYDPRHSLFFAWKEIIRHWYYLLLISMRNHRKGHPYLTFKDGMAMLREEKHWSARLRTMQE